ncbi:MAG: HAD family phosphatase [Alphaproteobacteria bacterium]|nr:HAD family phosphatase [Alphaproteobacteria bacterium]
MATGITTIVFDVGGVLIDWDPEYLYRKLIPDDEKRAFVLKHVVSRVWNGHQDLGLHTWADAVAARTSLFPEHAEMIKAYDTRWPEMVSGVIADVPEIQAALRAKGIPVYGITNFSSEKWADAQKLWPSLTEFDGVVVSGHEKMLKPDPGIYHLLCRRYGLDAQNCLFIDDVPANVEAAKSVGMMGHVFTNASALRETLQNILGISL